MPVNYEALGKRIYHFRSMKSISQDDLGEKIHVGFRHISNIELAKSKPSIDTVINIANALGVSADDLLVDSLDHSSSTADTTLYQMLLDCTKTEAEIITETAKHLKAILCS